MKPSFSVIIPTIGRKDLQNCLQNLFKQTYPKELFEVIVVEDGSGTAVRKIVESFGFAYFWQERRGPAAARNLGAKNAKGEILAFTDDDCEVPPYWLEKLADGYRRCPRVAGVGGYMEAPPAILLNNAYAQYESYMTHEVYQAGGREILGGFEVPTGGTNNISYRKDLFEKLGGFDETYPAAAGEDADFKKRVCDAGYLLLYLPLKVDHYHSYSWSSFLKQNRDRGLGSLRFHKKHGDGFNRRQLYRRLILSPLSFLKAVFLTKMALPVALLRWLALVVDYTTQLKLYGKI